MTLRFLSASLAVFALFLSLGSTAEHDVAQLETLPSSHWFDLKIGGKTIQAQLAVSPAEMSRGLMGRTDLQPDEGMLFVYRRPIQASFWMKNTPLPLDIGFFDTEGILLEVYPMFPYDETAVKSRSEQVRFALEMNQGWFSKNQLRRGVVLEIEGLSEALRARGFNPSDFGL